MGRVTFSVTSADRFLEPLSFRRASEARQEETPSFTKCISRSPVPFKRPNDLCRLRFGQPPGNTNPHQQNDEPNDSMNRIL